MAKLTCFEGARTCPDIRTWRHSRAIGKGVTDAHFSAHIIHEANNKTVNANDSELFFISKLFNHVIAIQ